MRVFADRFLLDDAEVMDLATGETVRLWIDPHPSLGSMVERVNACDVLAGLRHPLLVPLLDYGPAGEAWFEAYAIRPPVRAAGGPARRLALHLVRFLRTYGYELDAASAARHVRPAIEGSPHAAPRPIGWRHAWRSAVDAMRITIEGGGPPGVVCVTLSGPVGAGLRSARISLARVARMAGFVVLDSRFPAVFPHLSGRHCCVIDWLPNDLVLPSLLAHAGATNPARHLWLRFTREPCRGTFAVPLNPIPSAEMTDMLYRDPEYGPDEEEVRNAIQRSRGWPGPLIERLSGVRTPRAVALVHEIAPEYVLHPTPPSAKKTGDRSDAGIRRLLRVMEAAETVGARGRYARAERLLRRCVDALAARGASDAAARCARSLGDLRFARGRALEALEAYERARDLQPDGIGSQLLLAIGRAQAIAGRQAAAESALRTALGHGDAAVRREAAALLGDVLRRAGDHQRAEEIVKTDGADRTPIGCVLLARLRFLRGDLAAAAAAARAALSAGRALAEACEAHLVLTRIHHAMGEHRAALQSAADAMTAARRSRDRTLVLLACAARSIAAGGTDDGLRRRRLLTAAAKLPAARAQDLRELLACNETAGRSTLHDGDVLEEMLGFTQAAPDDERAVEAVVRYVHRALGACSTAAWTADQLRQIAAEGRPWTGEALARLTLNAGRGSFTPGVVSEAAEAVRAGGVAIGCLAARWPAGRAPAEADARRLLRLAAAAIAPAVAGLNSPRPAAALRADCPDALLGTGPAAERLRALIARAAAAPFPVLVEGESGSGKEVVARAVHARSVRRGRRFCAVNCAALTEDLLEAELFGHARGAFTGAAAERAGLFEDADQGTLFLDEVAELSARAQAKLLRVLQEGEVRRVGENLPRRIDVRIVAATNRPLETEVDSGRFRTDLRFRLDVLRIVVPPLRERADEIPALAERIWREAASRVGTRATLGSDLMLALARYAWPGNVRELQNVLAALAVHAPPRGRVPVALLPGRIAETAVRSPLGFDEARIDFERRFVQAALARSAGRKGLAAAQLGVTRQGLDKMLKRLGIG
jgi:DNA-binding NtrC family response regulator/tetratricopeptide (TPR) repeat protein